MTPLIKEISRLAKDAEKMMWFDLGELKDCEIEVDPELLTHLPFTDVGIVCTSTHENNVIQKFCVYAHQSDWDYPLVAATGFCLAPEFVTFPAIFIGCKDNKLILAAKSKDSKELVNIPLEGDAARICVLVDELTKRLSQQQTIGYKPEVPQTFTNKRLIKKGKKPLFSWRTVVVEPRPRTERTGTGTHASPRAHDRRGHWRTLKNKKVWVKSCKVGKPSNGVVFHDYKVKDLSEPKTA